MKKQTKQDNEEYPYVAEISFKFSNFPTKAKANEEYRTILTLIEEYIDDRGFWDVEDGQPEIETDSSWSVK